MASQGKAEIIDPSAQAYKDSLANALRERFPGEVILDLAKQLTEETLTVPSLLGGYDGSTIEPATTAVPSRESLAKYRRFSPKPGEAGLDPRGLTIKLPFFGTSLGLAAAITAGSTAQTPAVFEAPAPRDATPPPAAAVEPKLSHAFQALGKRPKPPINTPSQSTLETTPGDSVSEIAEAITRTVGGRFGVNELVFVKKNRGAIIPNTPNELEDHFKVQLDVPADAMPRFKSNLSKERAELAASESEITVLPGETLSLEASLQAKVTGGNVVAIEHQVATQSPDAIISHAAHKDEVRAGAKLTVDLSRLSANELADIIAVALAKDQAHADRQATAQPIVRVHANTLETVSNSPRHKDAAARVVSIVNPDSPDAPGNNLTAVQSVSGFSAAELRSEIEVIEGTKAIDGENVDPKAAAFITGDFMQESSLNQNAKGDYVDGIPEAEGLEQAQGSRQRFVTNPTLAGQTREIIEGDIARYPQFEHDLSAPGVSDAQLEVDVSGFEREAIVGNRFGYALAIEHYLDTPQSHPSATRGVIAHQPAPERRPSHIDLSSAHIRAAASHVTTASVVRTLSHVPETTAARVTLPRVSAVEASAIRLVPQKLKRELINTVSPEAVETVQQRIVRTAISIVNRGDATYNNDQIEFDGGASGWRDNTDCGRLQHTIMAMSGADPDYPLVSTRVQQHYLETSGKYETFIPDSISQLQPGDILIANGPGVGHTYMYVGQQENGHDAVSASLGQHTPKFMNAYFAQNGVRFIAARLK